MWKSAAEELARNRQHFGGVQETSMAELEEALSKKKRMVGSL